MRGSARIIIFDQDAENRERAVACLGARGYDVAQFPSVKVTLDAVKRLPADIVLLPLDMNEIQGMEIIRGAKAHNPEVSIIMMGMPGAVETNPNMLMFGGYEYILKPLHDEVLHAAVEQRLNQQHLYRICSALSVTLEADKVLDLLLETTLREVGAGQAVILLSERCSNILRVEAAKDLPGAVVGATYEVDDTSIMGFVLAGNEPIVLQGGFAQLPFIADTFSRDISSSVCAPIRIGGKTIGVLNINRLGSAAPFCQSDLRTIEIIALQTAVAIQNTRAHRYALESQRMQHELDLARSVQQSLFPKMSGYERYVEIVSKNIPAHMVGGDFFDFVDLGPDRFGLVIGDVAGKGVPGALLMVRTISNFRLRARPEKEPGRVIEELNNDLIEGCARGMYVTLIYAIFDFGRSVLRFASAGHPPLFLYHPSSDILRCPDEWTGIPMGILKDFRYETVELSLEPGDLAFLYTDGIMEAKNANEEDFSLARLKGLVKAGPPFPQQLVERVLSDLAKFTADRSQHDDLTMLAVGIKKVD
ncbi:MAG: SpoIIE family protein phosphatase, partial [Candidatus Hydrogenedentota bacterium]